MQLAILQLIELENEYTLLSLNGYQENISIEKNTAEHIQL